MLPQDLHTAEDISSDITINNKIIISKLKKDGIIINLFKNLLKLMEKNMIIHKLNIKTQKKNIQASI